MVHLLTMELHCNDLIQYLCTIFHAANGSVGKGLQSEPCNLPLYYYIFCLFTFQIQFILIYFRKCADRIVDCIIQQAINYRVFQQMRMHRCLSSHRHFGGGQVCAFAPNGLYGCL